MAHGGARRGAGRPDGIHTKLSPHAIERLKSRIQVDMILRRLHGLLDGTTELPPHAVTAGLGLLRKVMPDTAAVEHSGEISTTKVIRSPAVADTAKAWSAEHVPEGHTEH